MVIRVLTVVASLLVLFSFMMPMGAGSVASASLPIVPMQDDSPEETEESTAISTAAPETATPAPTVAVQMYVPHYALGRPIAEGGMNLLDRNYPYGDTQRGAWPVHHGVEFQNPRGTPIIAAAEGYVIYAGDDSGIIFGPKYDFYGNLVVIQHNFLSPTRESVFTLYGHMERVDVTTGSVVEAGDRLGVVGATGVAIGPHLHFEVRVGDPYDYNSTSNPEMWIYPQTNTATLIGRVVDAEGNFQYGVPVQLRRAGATNTNLVYYGFTYGDDTVNASPAWNENFIRGDLRPGDYEVYVSTLYGRKLYDEVVTLEGNQIQWLEITIPPGQIFIPQGPDAGEDETPTPTLMPTAVVPPLATEAADEEESAENNFG